MSELDEEVGQCGCCGCAPVPTYPTAPHGEYFDDADRACVWCLREYTPSEWGVAQ